METLKNILTHPFFWGFVLGMVFCVLALWAGLKSRRELAKYKRHLSDKLEIEADHMAKVKAEAAKLRDENENLRLKVNTSRVSDSAQSLERELEIYARAEKAMIINAPGFAQAWETAKVAANDELVTEERGKSLPKRIFRKFTRTDATPSTKALPSKEENSEELAES